MVKYVSFIICKQHNGYKNSNVLALSNRFGMCRKNVTSGYDLMFCTRIVMYSPSNRIPLINLKHCQRPL